MAEERRTILVIDDEEHILRLLEMNLKSWGYYCLSAATGEEGLQLAREHRPDLIILDVMLPGMDGIEVCRSLKGEEGTVRIPVLMLSARSEGDDKIAGLTGGADDYITKPFSLEELSARITASLRQVELLASNGAPGILKTGRTVLDSESYKVTVSGERMDITLTEFRILHALMRTPGSVVPRRELTLDVFEKEPEEAGRTLDVHIRHLRRKLGDPADCGCAIETVRGRGLRIIATE